jgi:hypothetical protein
MHEPRLNGAPGKAMGHLGSSLERKSSTIFRIKSRGNGYKIENRKCINAKEIAPSLSGGEQKYLVGSTFTCQE